MVAKKMEFDYRNSPTAWFCVLETEQNRGNFERAAEAKRELERLGVFVRFRGKAVKKLAEAERVLLDEVNTKRQELKADESFEVVATQELDRLMSKR